MFSPRFTVILLVILVVPLLLRLRDLEPYPAVMFPSGPGVHKLTPDKTVAMDAKKLMGLKPDGTWQEIDSRTFLQPASIQNLTPLININFGLEDKKKKKKKQSKFQFVKDVFHFDRPPLTDENARALKHWLNTRLAGQGFMPNHIKVHTFTRTISTETGTVINKTIKDERIITFAE